MPLLSPNFCNPKLLPYKLDTYWVRQSILRFIRSQRPLIRGTLLDVGCGQKPYKSLLTSPPSKVERYIGLDLDNNPIHENQPDITWQNGQIPLDDASVDCAICTEVFEHCPKPEDVMKEIYRVLKPEGLLFFTVPFLWPLHEVPYDEYRYTPFSLQRHLTNSGFINIDLHPLGGWDASLAQMIGLWVRRRPMNRWLRRFLSILVWPLLWFIFKLEQDRKSSTRFDEGTMLTGLSGTARKAQ